MKSTASILLVLVFAVGCTSIQTSHNFEGVQVDGNTRPISVVAIENYGWYLFGLFPLVTGDPDHPNENSCRLFHNTVTLENNVKMLAEKARTEKATNLANIRSITRSDLAIGFFILGRRIAFTSAVICQPTGDDPYHQTPAPRHGVPQSEHVDTP